LLCLARYLLSNKLVSLFQLNYINALQPATNSFVCTGIQPNNLFTIEKKANIHYIQIHFA